MASQSINLSDPALTKIKALYNICASLIPAAEPGLTPDLLRWRAWFYTYLMWHEGKQLTTRRQLDGGPGRGLMQFEATTTWDTIKLYVMGPTPGLVARLATAADVDAPQEMTPALRAFATLANPKNKWPTSDPANKIEAWLLNSDSFGIALMQIQFQRFKVDLPPIPPAKPDQDPRLPQFHPQFADVWADSWWKGPPSERPAKIKSFLANANGMDQALKGPLVRLPVKRRRKVRPERRRAARLL